MNENSRKREYSLVDSLSGECLWFPVDVMRDVGPAVQTLAALLNLAAETHLQISKIARTARLSLKTCRNHLILLRGRGWLDDWSNGGRHRLKVAAKAWTAMSHYGILPWWASGNIRTVWEGRMGRRPRGHMPWGAKAVLSLVMARLKEASTAGNVSRRYWNWSIEQLSQQTGLHGESVVQAKRWLADYLIIDQYRTLGHLGGSGRHILEPSARFRVVETPAGPGNVFLDFVKAGVKAGIK